MGRRGPNAKPVKKKATAKARKKPIPWNKRGLSRAERVIAFIEYLKITSGSLAGEQMILRDWQKDIVYSLYATDDDDIRRIRQALVTLPRKQGKTQLAAALALAHLVGPEVEQRGQIFSAAADRDQAGLIFREMKAMLQEAPELEERVIIRDFNKQMEDSESGSTYQALSSDARKAHGLNASFVVCDELAQWRGRELYDNLLTSMGARSEPLMVTISTQSADQHSVMTELVRYGESILAGTETDPSFYACIYSAPEDADPWDEKTWFACNPALDDFRSLEEFRTAAAQARRLPAREPSFRLLYLNQAVSTEARLINAADWQECKGNYSVESLKGRVCWGGLDLGSTTDLTSLVLLFPLDDGTLQTLCWFWVPDENIKERSDRDRVPYQQWAKDGFIMTTSGRAIDKDYIVHTLGEVSAMFDVQAIAYDRWRIEDLMKQLSNEGIDLNLTSWGQGYKDMGPAVDSLETAILNRTLKHNGNPVLTWCAANAVVTQDPTGARKFDKAKSYERIDGIVSLSMGLGLFNREPAPFSSVYADRGLVTITV